MEQDSSKPRQNGVYLYLIGNTPSDLLVSSLYVERKKAAARVSLLTKLTKRRRHKLELKMWTLLGGALACTAVAYQFAQSTAWFDNASARAGYDPASNVTSAAATPRLSPAWYGGETWGMLRDGHFWVSQLDILSAAWNIFTLSILPWVVINGWSVLRRSTLGTLAAASVGVNTVVFLGLSLLNGSDTATGSLYDSASFALRWFAQLIPALVAPVLLGGALKPFVKHAFRLQFASMFALIAFSFFVLSVLTPAFVAATPIMQVVLRVFVFTFGFEVAVASMRVCTKVAFTPYLPRDRLIALAGQAIIVAGISGRFLTGSMDSTAGTVLIAALISVTELTLRLTLPARDRLILGWCLSVCPQCRATARRSKGLHADPRFKQKVLLRRETAAPAGSAAERVLGGAPAAATGGERDESSSISLHSEGTDSLEEGGAAPQVGGVKMFTKPAEASSQRYELSTSPGPAGSGSVDTYQPPVGPSASHSLGASLNPTVSAATGSLVEGGATSPLPDSEGCRLPQRHVVPSLALGAREDDSKRPSALAGIEARQTADERVQEALQSAKRRAAREAQDVHSFFSLLTLDTMAEDVGILASLAFGLLFRSPARRGGAPAVISEVLLRVLLQYILEFLTDLAPALCAWAVNTCCGVRWRKARKHAIRAAVRRALLRAQLPQNVDGVGTPFVSEAGDVEWVPERGISALDAANAEVAGELQGGGMLDDTSMGSLGVDDNRTDSLTDAMIELPAVWRLAERPANIATAIVTIDEDSQTEQRTSNLRGGGGGALLPSRAPLPSLDTIKELDHENESTFTGSVLRADSAASRGTGQGGSERCLRQDSAGSASMGGGLQQLTPTGGELAGGAPPHGSPVHRGMGARRGSPLAPDWTLPEASDEDTDTDTGSASDARRSSNLQSASDNSARITLQQHAVPPVSDSGSDASQPTPAQQLSSTASEPPLQPPQAPIDGDALPAAPLRAGPAAAAPKQRRSCSALRAFACCRLCRPCILRSSDRDVAAQRSKLLAEYAQEIQAITRDPVWQPIEWRQLLKIGVEGSTRHRRRSRAHSTAGSTASQLSGQVPGALLPLSSRISVVSDSGASAPSASRGEGGADDPSIDGFDTHIGVASARDEEHGTGGGTPSRVARLDSHVSALGAEEEDEEPPATVLWQPVYDLKDLSRVQLWVAWFSIRSETLAVRLSRAWERRFPGWSLFFLLAALSAALVNSRAFYGVASSCRQVDDSGVQYYDVCPDSA